MSSSILMAAAQALRDDARIYRSWADIFKRDNNRSDDAKACGTLADARERLADQLQEVQHAENGEEGRSE